MFLYEYMTLDEREDAILEAQFERDSMALDHMFESTRAKHEIRLKDIETECLIKEYTDDDLENMYMHEMSVYTEGVKEWWENFKKWFQNLLNKVFKKPEEPAPEAKDNQITLPCNPKDAENILDKTKNMVKNITNYQKDDGSGSIDGDKVLKGLGIAAAAGGLATAIAAALSKPFRTTIGNAFESFTNIFVNKVESLKNEINSTNPDGGEEAAKKAKGVKELITTVLSPITSLANKVRGAFSKGKHEKGVTVNGGKDGKHSGGDQQDGSGTTDDNGSKSDSQTDSGTPETTSGESQSKGPGVNGGNGGAEQKPAEQKPAATKPEDQKPAEEQKPDSTSSSGESDADKTARGDLKNDLINTMKQNTELKKGWDALAAARPKKGKKKSQREAYEKYKNMANLKLLEELFDMLGKDHPDRMAARKCINYLRDHGLKDVTEAVAFEILLEMFEDWDRENGVIMEAFDDIGSSLMDSLDDPFNFMEESTAGSYKDLVDLLNTL